MDVIHFKAWFVFQGKQPTEISIGTGEKLM